MNSAWIGLFGGLIGILIGSGLTEYFRRTSRIETYSAAIFQKRLSIYEALFNKIAGYQDIVAAIMADEKHSDEERHIATSHIVLDIAKYCDENAFYLNEELVVLCTCAYMGAEDVMKLKDLMQREERVQTVRNNLADAKEMIRREAGIKRIDKFFGTVTKAKLSGHIIERYREIAKSKNSQE